MKLRYKIILGAFGLVAVAMISVALVLSHDSACAEAPAPVAGVESMQVVLRTCYGGPDVLQLAAVEKPVPADNEVLVKVHAASVNPLDWHYMRGSPYIMRLGSGLGAPKSQRLGVDFAGTVESVGRNVSRFEPGDEVFGGAWGAFGEYVSVPEDGSLVPKPAEISFEQAASVPIAATTALQALRDAGKIKAGHKVLINGASGGVGTFAVQIAKSFGAEVTGVCSTRNVELVKSLGADHVFDYTREDYTDSGRTWDLIIDNVGNNSPWANRRVMSADGILVMIGGSKGDWVGPLLRPIQGMLLSPFVDQKLVLFLAQQNAADLRALSDLMRMGRMTPVIDQRFDFRLVDEAIRYSEGGHARGKIVIDMPVSGIL